MSQWRNVSTSELGYYVRVEKRVYLELDNMSQWRNVSTSELG